MKVLLVTLVLLLSCSQVAQSQECSDCFYKKTQDRYGCVSSCTDPGGGCGGCCKLVDQGNACYVGGCCLIQAQHGFCYDRTGASCGNQYGCSNGTVASSAALKEHLLAFQNSDSSEHRTVLSDVPWIADKDFPSRLRQYSPTIAKAVALFQETVATAPETSMKDYAVGTFSAVLRPHFPSKVKVSHATTDQWAVYLEKADTEKEGPNAPVMLQVNGNTWTMYRALPTPGPDGHLREAVAEGTVQ